MFVTSARLTSFWASLKKFRFSPIFRSSRYLGEACTCLDTKFESFLKLWYDVIHFYKRSGFFSYFPLVYLNDPDKYLKKRVLFIECFDYSFTK